jgi:hypothetical protein
LDLGEQERRKTSFSRTEVGHIRFVITLSEPPDLASARQLAYLRYVSLAM